MIISYGHKHGIPQKVDKDFDVRDLSHDITDATFLQRYREIVDYGRKNPGHTIGIGCEKGQHRSVVLANKAATALRTSVYHRDK